MADFKTALEALARGELKAEILIAKLEKLLQKSPQLKDSILKQMRDALAARQIDEATFQALSKRVERMGAQRVPGRAEQDQPTVFAADSTETLDEDERTRIEEEAKQAATQITRTGMDATGGLDLDLSGPSHPSGPSSWPTGSSWGEAGKGQAADAVKIGPGAVIKERFQLDEVLGVGGMGTVYKGRDLLKVEARDRNPYIALKVLNEDFKKHPDSFIALQREASRQQRLAHPNIATVYDFDRTGSTVFLTMELLEGIPLNKYIKKEVLPKAGLPLDQALPIIQGLGAALAYAHERQIVHSDFKPGNCFLTQDGAVKVLDFGIARAVKNPGQGEGEKTLFDPGKLGALTPAYASAEMLEGQDPHPQDDIYALACVTYELLTGKHPFNKLPAHTARDNKLVPAPIKGLKRRQMKALAKGLAFSRADRSQNVQEFLDGLEGKSAAYKNPYLIGAAAAVLLILLAIGPITSYLHKRQLDEIIARAQTDDPAVIASVLETVTTLNPADQKTVTTEARESIIGYFERQVAERVDPGRGHYDYPGAERVLMEAEMFYPDSAMLQRIVDRVEESKNQLLSQLTERYNSALEEGRLLPREEEDDVSDILAVVAQVDPRHPLMSDPRLPAAFAQQTERAIAELDFNRAEDLLAGGLAMAPRDVNLINLQDKVRASRLLAEQQSSIDELVARLEQTETAIDDLEGAKPLVSDLVQLQAIDPDNALIARLSEKLTPMVEAQISDIIEARRWSQGERLLEDFDGLFTALGLDEQRQRMVNANEQYNREVNNLVAEITRTVVQDKLGPPEEPNATTLLERLAVLAPDSPRTLRARDQVAQGYLKNARLARAAGNWDEARQQVALAEAIQPGDIVRQTLEREMQQIARSEEQSKIQLAQEEQERLQQERQEQLAALSQEFDQKLAAMDPTVTGAADVLATVDQIEAIAPTDPLVAKGKEQVAGKLADGALTLGEAGRWEDGLQLTRDALALLPGAAVLSDTLNRLQEGQQTALAEAERQAIEDSKERVAGLLAAPALDSAWENSIQAALRELEGPLPADDPWFAEIRAQVASLYVERAGEMQDAQRFTEAYSLLDRAERYSPGLETVGRQRQLVAEAEQIHEQERQAQMRVARLEGMKQDLLTQARARQVTAARRTFDELKQELPADDPFITTEAPEAIADAYYRLATGKAEGGEFEDALKFAEAGLEFVPGMARLQQAVQDYRLEGSVAELFRTLKTDASLNVARSREQLAMIESADAQRHAQISGELGDLLVERIGKLRDSDASAANQLLEGAKQLFPQHPALARLEPAVARPQPSRYAEAIQKHIADGALSEARKLLDEGLKAEPDHPEVEKVQLALADRVAAAEKSFSDYQVAFKDQKLEQAKTSLEQATQLWKDNPTFTAAQKELLAALEPPKPAVEPPKPEEEIAKRVAPIPGGQPCEPGLAGHGRRAAGTCFDMIDARIRGPYMVVVPAGGGIARPFAIGKYEISVNDYNAYCRLSGQCPGVRASDGNLPVTGITLDQAKAYAKWLSERTGGAYRLPTDAEWVYAAEAQGQQPPKDHNCRVTMGGQVLKGQSAVAINVGKSNGWGLFNYIGNVQEWVNTGASYAARGGAFSDTMSQCDISLKRNHDGRADETTGFRLVLELG